MHTTEEKDVKRIIILKLDDSSCITDKSLRGIDLEKFKSLERVCRHVLKKEERIHSSNAHNISCKMFWSDCDVLMIETRPVIRPRPCFMVNVID